MADAGMDLGSQIGKLTPQQRQAVLMRAQQEANTQIMQKMMEKMVAACYEKCAGTSVRDTETIESLERIWWFLTAKSPTRLSRGTSWILVNCRV